MNTPHQTKSFWVLFLLVPSSHLDNIHSSSFPSAVDTYTPTAQYHLPFTSSSAAPSHHQTLRSFHSPDRPPQVSSLLLGPSAGNSQRHTEFSRLASSERSDGMRGPASGACLQTPALPGPFSAVLPGTVLCR